MQQYHTPQPQHALANQTFYVERVKQGEKVELAPAVLNYALHGKNRIYLKGHILVIVIFVQLHKKTPKTKHIAISTATLMRTGKRSARTAS